MLAETVTLAGTTIVDGSGLVLEEADWGVGDPKAVIASSGDTDGGAVLRPVRREPREVQLTVSAVATSATQLARTVGLVQAACERASRQGGELVRTRTDTGQSVRANVLHASCSVDVDFASVRGRRARLKLRLLVDPWWRGDPIGPRYDPLTAYPGDWVLASGSQVLRLQSDGTGWETYQAGIEVRYLPSMPALRCWHLVSAISNDGTGTTGTAGQIGIGLRSDDGTLLTARLAPTTTTKTLYLVQTVGGVDTVLASQSANVGNQPFLNLQLSDGVVRAYTDDLAVTGTVDPSTRWRPALRANHQGQVLRYDTFDARPNSGDSQTPCVLRLDVPGDAPAEIKADVISFFGRSTMIALGTSSVPIRGQPVALSSGSLLTGASLATRSGSIASQVVRATAFEVPRTVVSLPFDAALGRVRVYLRAYVGPGGAGVFLRVLDKAGIATNLPLVSLSDGWQLADLGVVDLGSIDKLFVAIGAANVTVDLDCAVMVPAPITQVSWQPQLVADDSAPNNQSDGFDGAAGPLAGRVAPTGGTWSSSYSNASMTITGNGFALANLTANQGAIHTLGPGFVTGQIAGCAAAAFDPSQWPAYSAVGVFLCYRSGATSSYCDYRASVFVGGDNQCYARFERYSNIQGNKIYATVPVPGFRTATFQIAGAIWSTGHWALWAGLDGAPVRLLASGRDLAPPTQAQNKPPAMFAASTSGNFAPLFARYFGMVAPPPLPQDSGNTVVTFPGIAASGPRPTVQPDSDGLGSLIVFAPPTAPGVGQDDPAPWPATRVVTTLTPRYTIAPWDR